MLYSCTHMATVGVQLVKVCLRTNAMRCSIDLDSMKEELKVVEDGVKKTGCRRHPDR